MSENDSKNKKKYITKKSKELEKLLDVVKEYKFNSPTSSKVEFKKKNPLSIAEFTKDTCLYPTRYLNNDNTCITCDLYEHCGCRLKNLGKKKKNE